jgi:hypothetical protein
MDFSVGLAAHTATALKKWLLLLLLDEKNKRQTAEAICPL